MITYTELKEKIHDPAIVDKLKSLLDSGEAKEFLSLYKNPTSASPKPKKSIKWKLESDRLKDKHPHHPH